MFYLELFRALEKEKVRYLVVGGVTISLISSQDLIALKSGTGRKVDESDIRALHRLDMLRSRRRDD